jgi:hypothetical protein
MKGQIVLSTLIVLFVVLLMFLYLVPVINTANNTTVAELQAHPNDGTDATIAVIYLIPFAIALSIILSALNQANPRVEYRGGGRRY